MVIKRLFFIALILFYFSSLGWAAPERLTDARVMFTDVKDTRSTDRFFGKCEIELKVMGRLVAQSRGIRRVWVDYAVDDTGIILLDKEQNGSAGFFQRNEKGDSTLNATVRLKNPDRSARTIQVLRGTLELFLPTQKNGGKVSVGTFMERPGQPIAEDQLKAHGATLQYLTKEILEKRKKEEMARAKSKAGKEMDQLGEQMGQAFLQMFEGMMGGFMGDDKNSLQFWVKDPNDRIVDLEFLDGNGKRMKTQSRSTMGELRQVGFKTLPGLETKMVIYLATEESVRPVEFSLNEIPLP